MLFIALGRADTTKLESRANVGLSYFGRITLVRFNPGSKLSSWVNCFPISNLIKEENQVAVVGPVDHQGVLALVFIQLSRLGTFCDENLLNLLNFLNFMS